MPIDKTINSNALHSQMSSHNFFTLILSCFFISGLTGLVYQILWTRMIVKIIGSAPFAVSIVLTVFMGGLGIGSYIAGRIIDRVRYPLALIRIYGLLEIGVGAYGLVLPFFLSLFRLLYGNLYNHFFHHFISYTLLTFLGCSILLLFPVILMGATLPVLSRFFIGNLSQLGTHVGRLYGLNTIGAAFGSLLCGFWLIHYLSVVGSLLFAVILNFFIGAVCLIASRKWKNILPTSENTVHHGADFTSWDEMPRHAKDPVWHALTIFAISGFCAMAYEVIWVKLLGLLVGPTTYSFTIVLVTFITGLALGSIFFGWLVDKIRRPTFLLMSTQIFAAFSAIVVSQLIGNGQIFFAKLIQAFQDNFTQLMLIQSSVLFCFMFFPTFCLGATFPLVGKIYTRSLCKTGRSIGYAYSLNTIGAVLGSFFAGFVFIPFLGKEQSIRIITGFQMISTLVIWIFLLWFSGKKRLIPFPAAVIAVSLVFFSLFQFPHWNRLMLAKGKYHRFDQLKKHDLGWMDALISGTEVHSKDSESELAFYADGIGGFTSVLQTRPDIFGQVHYALLNSGKADASSQKGDMSTQTLLAHFPMLFHPHAREVLILGFASGISAGEVLHYPVTKLDMVEINSQVVKASDFFRPWNNHVLDNPKTELIIQDGRAHLELTDRKYDVIISEPSNPWMAGLATLFTAEFIQLAKNRLNENGIFVQWLHSYQMNWETFAMVGRTFASVFPNGILVSTNPISIFHGPDFLLIGFKNDIALDIGTAAKNLPYAAQSMNIKLPAPELLYNLIVSENLRRLFGSGTINTDNFPHLEYAAPKLLHYTKSAEEIADMLKSNQWVSSSTMRVKEINQADLERMIQWDTFCFAFNLPDNKIPDLSKATADQKKRYMQLLESYCSETPIHDFSFLNDPGMKNSCINAHLNSIDQRAESSPDKTEHYYYMGWVCNSNGLPYDAARYFIKALNYNPKDAKTNDALKKLCLAKDVGILSTLLSNELSSAPNNPALYYHAGILYQRFGQTDAAYNYYEKAAALDSLFILPMNQIAALAVAKGDYASAMAAYQKMIAINPRQPVLYYNIACLFSRQNRPTESIEWLKKSIEKGYNKWEMIQTDKDLDNIRGTVIFQEFMKNNKPG